MWEVVAKKDSEVQTCLLMMSKNLYGTSLSKLLTFHTSCDHFENYIFQCTSYIYYVLPFYNPIYTADNNY